MKKKRIALVAHDNRKVDLAEWVNHNKNILINHNLICTGTTGKLVEKTLAIDGEVTNNELSLRNLKSGPLGGDQQLGSLVSEGEIDIFIFFWDPMQAQPHDVDVKALLRICVLYNVPTAMNRSTADYMISSTLFEEEYDPILKDYSEYINRNV